MTVMARKQAPALFDQLAKSLQVEGEELAAKVKVCTRSYSSNLSIPTAVHCVSVLPSSC